MKAFLITLSALCVTFIITFFILKSPFFLLAAGFCFCLMIILVLGYSMSISPEEQRIWMEKMIEERRKQDDM